MNRFCGHCVRGAGAALVAVLLAAAMISSAYAQAHNPPPVIAPSEALNNPMAVPGFWDPRRRPERPDLSRISIIRFLTDLDYPPFDYAGADGNPAGFNVDLA